MKLFLIHLTTQSYLSISFHTFIHAQNRTESSIYGLEYLIITNRQIAMSKPFTDIQKKHCVTLIFVKSYSFFEIVLFAVCLLYSFQIQLDTIFQIIIRKVIQFV